MIPALLFPMRDRINALEMMMRQMPQAELRTEHYFADGMYCRLVARKKDVVIVGKVHKKEHFYIVAKGSIQIEDDIYPAGTVIVSKPGTKRAVYALEDSICLTVHRTRKRNLEKLEKELVEEDEHALFDSSNQLKALK